MTKEQAVEAVARAIAEGCNLNPDAPSPNAAKSGHHIPEWQFFVPAAHKVIAAMPAASEQEPRVERWRKASIALGAWLSAALDDGEVCEEMKADIREWFSAGEPFESMAASEQELIEVQRDADRHVMICTGCGTVETIDSIRRRKPGSFSCCPERKMVRATPSPADQDKLVAELVEVARMVVEASDLAGFSGPLGDAARVALTRARQIGEKP